MTAAEKRAALERHSFFRGVAPPLLDLLSSQANDFAIASGQHLGRENQPATRFFALYSGRVALDIPTPNRGPVTVQTISAGEVVGWSWLVPPHQWKFDCRVVQDATGLAWDGAWLRHECHNNHELGLFVLKGLLGVVAARLAATRLQLLDVYQ
jgi:hypothetical protein